MKLTDFLFSFLFPGSGAPESKEHSIGSAATLPRGRIENDAQSTDRCPPDLLSFPGKSNQGSPVDNIPYLATTDRSPYPRPQKLLNSPQYSGQFGTLPYSRSHSPFSPPLSVVPRQSGYVTIPRRPRVPSWSNSLSPVVVSPDEPFIAEPIYDNLGRRTTADGSSVVSLNKCDTSIPVSYKNRPLPQTPSDPKKYYEPISELDSFSPILKNSRTPNIVNRSNPTIDILQRDASTPESKRQSWARVTPEGAQIHSTDETESLISPGTTNPNIVPSSKKIPPNPPPKPKKKLNKNPFYEDEGEDGTEV